MLLDIMSVQAENSVLLRIQRTTEVQTDINICDEVIQYNCNINPAHLSAQGAVPIFSRQPIAYFFVKQVLKEQNEIVFRSTATFINIPRNLNNIFRDNSTQTDISAIEFNEMYSQMISEHNCDTQNVDAHYDNNINPIYIPASNLHFQTAQTNFPNVMYVPMNNVNYYYPKPPLMVENIDLYNYNNLCHSMSQMNIQPVEVPPSPMQYPQTSTHFYSTPIYYPIAQFHYLVNDFSSVIYPNYIPNYIAPPMPYQNVVFQPSPTIIYEQLPPKECQQPAIIENVVDENGNQNVPKENVSVLHDNNGNEVLPVKNRDKRQDKVYRSVYCAFCHSNGEAKSFYESHQLRGPKKQDGKIPIVCPVLMAYVCKICGSTGENSHTESHCPQNTNRRISTAKIVTRSQYNSNGRIRRMWANRNH